MLLAAVRISHVGTKAVAISGDPGVRPAILAAVASWIPGASFRGEGARNRHCSSVWPSSVVLLV